MDEHKHKWQIVYDDIDGGCIIVYAVCTVCGKRIEKHEVEQVLNGQSPT